FTADEAAAFLTEARGLPLAAQDVAALEERTEGWVAGLHLAALSLQGRDDVAGFIAAFTGSHRHLGDYLVEEVLERQPTEVQTFLLQTAVLDRLSGPLCDALMDRGGGSLRPADPSPGSGGGQAMLERLEAANLFVVPLDDQRHWYRYHHLFADFLRHRLRRACPDQVAVLHRRAAGWHEQAGLLHEAVGHALAGADVERAARRVGQAAGSRWM